MSQTIHVAMLVAGRDSADLAIGDLWRTAQSAVPDHVQLTGTALYAAAPGQAALANLPELEIRALEVPNGGPATRAASAIAAKPGPMGVIARLVYYNLSSHRVARALASDTAMAAIFAAADIIVSADPEADWAVWNLRKKTAAPLIHGPFAMANVLSEMARK